ncbi:(2Fe-2S)-binding protein [Paraburkholderia sp. SARCC-3016]|uniref:(2Fe-2S)-binding protein n=1 Tax=Paraburkholderia sp. SARCC-3016 TaxID=3058611 RepID=UPI002809EC8A|nr:2Fe-2S iron-sulfur cluster-binding protein [Paraburkholderia sp. SARCC-3016]MDQ7978814.1 (2Fe-2S)-binding protein [Paraburkholderia sp. SARCC-3016]
MTLSSPQEFELTVNGTRHRVRAEPSTPLLYILRQDLQLKGVRFGCGAGHCGSCTVQIDGRAVQSCDLPLEALGSSVVTTIEGLGTAATPHPVQQAFVDEQAAQCGYCINGIMMSVAALIEHNPAPDDAELLRALDRHLCRCGTHVRILRAARRAIAALAAARESAR